jgi:hypothetical protein
VEEQVASVVKVELEDSSETSVSAGLHDTLRYTSIYPQPWEVKFLLLECSYSQSIGERSFAYLMISLSIYDLFKRPLRRSVMSLLGSFELDLTNDVCCLILFSKGRDCNSD